MSERTISHYRLLGVLGRGGMAVVYKAEDSRLHRFVALKLLSDHISQDPVARDRFHREAEAASALNHPGICTIHDVGHADGSDFIVMEYLEGSTLDRAIASGSLPYATMIGIALEIADALDAAHTAGIRKLVIVTAGAATPKALDVPVGAAGVFRFTPDGSAIAYLVRRDGKESIQIHPLDGSAARDMVFSGDPLGQFRWSPDGSTLAVVRQRVDSDVVLLRDGEGQRR